MTRYEQGFMSKCAEYGVDGHVLLEKQAKIPMRNAVKYIQRILEGGMPGDPEGMVLHAIGSGKVGKRISKEVAGNLDHLLEIAKKTKALANTGYQARYSGKLGDIISAAGNHGGFGPMANDMTSAAKRLLQSIGYAK